MFWAFCPSSSSSSSSSFSFSNNYATLFHPNFTDFDTPSFQIKIMWALPVRMNASSSDFSEKELNETIINNPDYACTGDQRSDFIPLPKLQGYRCKCKDGFMGDGYAHGTGCSSKNIPSHSHSLVGSTYKHTHTHTLSFSLSSLDLLLILRLVSFARPLNSKVPSE